MNYLVLMQIAYDIEQLGDETVSILTSLEIVWIVNDEVFQVLTIDIFR